jgi:hypothetical protein
MPKCLGERAAAGLSQLHTAAVELRGCFCLQILSMRYLTTGCWISSLRLELLSCRGNNVWDNKLKTSTIKEWLYVTKVGVPVGVKNLSFLIIWLLPGVTRPYS